MLEEEPSLKYLPSTDPWMQFDFSLQTGRLRQVAWYFREQSTLSRPYPDGIFRRIGVPFVDAADSMFTDHRLIENNSISLIWTSSSELAIMFGTELQSVHAIVEVGDVFSLLLDRDDHLLGVSLPRLSRVDRLVVDQMENPPSKAWSVPAREI